MPKPPIPIASFRPHPCPPLYPNPTPYRGVRPLLLRGWKEPLWSPVICLKRAHDGKIIRLGLYKTPEAALRTRKAALKILMGGPSLLTSRELHDACTAPERVRVKGLPDDVVSVELIREVAGEGETVIETRPYR